MLRLISVHQSAICSSQDEDSSDLSDERDMSDVEATNDQEPAHIQEPVKNVPCFYGGKTFKNKRAVDTHMRSCDEK